MPAFRSAPWGTPASRLGRHRAALCLLLAGSIALLGAEQILGAVAVAQTTEAVVDTHNLQPLPEMQERIGLARVNGAVSTGQFEAIVMPTATATPALPPTLASSPRATPTATPARTVYESGIASTYGEGDGFEGNLTACGQVFHTNVVQIAHKSLPCGTRVMIEDTNTGRSIEAVVTDRGPYVPGRIVDLSWAAFRQLDPTGPGLLQVNVYLLDSQSTNP
jgi:rare lipoprotein A (peptidoglycan hydrolase)